MALDVKVGMTKNVLCRQMQFENVGDSESSCEYRYPHTILVAKGAIKFIRGGEESPEQKSPIMLHMLPGPIDGIIATENDTLIFNVHVLRKEDGTIDDEPPMNEDVIEYLKRLTIK
jgi:hypothetical protein